MNQQATRLRWTQRAGRFFADGSRGTYRVRPADGGWIFDYEVDGSGWTEMDTCTTAAAAKRAAQSREDRP